MKNNKIQFNVMIELTHLKKEEKKEKRCNKNLKKNLTKSCM